MTLANRAYKLRAVERFLATDEPTVPRACLSWLRIELHRTGVALAGHVERLERLHFGCTRAVQFAARFGRLPAPEHTAWVIDQMVRAVFVGHVPRHLAPVEGRWQHVPTHDTPEGRYLHWRRQQVQWGNGQPPGGRPMAALEVSASHRVAEPLPPCTDADPRSPDLTAPGVPHKQVAALLAEVRAEIAELNARLDQVSQRSRACVHMLEIAARTPCLPAFPGYRTWLIDQMVRALLGECPSHERDQLLDPHPRYARWRAAHPDWDEGMAPP